MRLFPLSLRARLAVELGLLAAATALFLVAFPARTIALDVPLALLGLLLVGLNARFTREVVWARAAGQESARGGGLGAPTALAVAALLLAGAAIGYHAGGWPGAARRLLRAGMLPAFCFYLLWALLQQTLFQFYLLGRLKRLLPGAPALALCAVNGLAFLAVHWPDPALMAVTAAAGVVWSLSYWKHGRLWPVAVSHALLGSTFYYWVYGRDLSAIWLRLASSHLGGIVQ